MNIEAMTDEELFALHTETRHIEPENGDQRRYKADTLGALADEFAMRLKASLEREERHGKGWKELWLHAGIDPNGIPGIKFGEGYDNSCYLNPAEIPTAYELIKEAKDGR